MRDQSAPDRSLRFDDGRAAPVVAVARRRCHARDPTASMSDARMASKATCDMSVLIFRLAGVRAA